MAIEDTELFKQVVARVPELSGTHGNSLAVFNTLRERIQQESKYMVLPFPEYTPHDDIHLENLFRIADKVLETALYERLNAAELLLLFFALYGHDWGMTVSSDERAALESEGNSRPADLLPDEPKRWTDFREQKEAAGSAADDCWAEYVRRTHGLRSGQRLRNELDAFSSTFAENVGKIAEGHTLDIHEIRNPEHYPIAVSVLGETANIAALTCFVRIIDLLDIGDDRTPFALWKFIAPRDVTSAMEWEKHHALGGVAVDRNVSPSKISFSGVTKEPEVYARLKDLEVWVGSQFAECLSVLGTFEAKYHLGLDSLISWKVDAKGFEPISVRFEMDRERLLDLLVEDVYSRDRHVFLRELLQNSVDAIETRQALSPPDVTLEGRIDVVISTNGQDLELHWQDNGIGMDRRTVQDFLAVIGKSYYRSPEFYRSRTGYEPLSRFGIGILSCFLVSRSLEFETRKDAPPGGSSEGLSIRVPDKTAHFHVRSNPSAAIGTTVTLTIQKEIAPEITAQSVLQYLRDIIGFVKHRVRVTLDDGVYELPAVGSADEATSPDGVVQMQKEVELSCYIGEPDRQEQFLANVYAITLQATDEASHYQGYYSVLMPKDPAGVYRETGGYRFLDGMVFEALYQSTNSAVELGVRGVGGFSIDGLHSSAAQWPAPRLLLDTTRPSVLQPNLGRDKASIVETEWLTRFWKAIGSQFRRKLGDVDGGDLRNQAMAVGAALYFGHLPYEAITDWFEPLDWPVLLLRAGEGLAWGRAADAQPSGLIVEAPTELSYAVGELLHDNYRPPEQREALSHWAGPTSLVLSHQAMGFHYHPAQSAALTNAYDVIESQGYALTSLSFKTQPASEEVPLVCRVWEKDSTSLAQPSVIAEALTLLPRSVHRRSSRAHVLSLVGSDMPELVSFQGEFSGYAAVGSVFWNINHPKIQSFVAMLLRLAGEIARNPIPADLRHDYLVNCDLTKAGHYRNAARIDSRQFALERFQTLRSLAARLNLHGLPDSLEEADYVPGTLGKYRNPSRYDFSSWVEGENVGADL